MLFFRHGCLDAEEVLVCFIKSIILDSGLQIFEFYMVLKLGSSGMGRNRLCKVSLCGLISVQVDICVLMSGWVGFFITPAVN